MVGWCKKYACECSCSKQHLACAVLHYSPDDINAQSGWRALRTYIKPSVKLTSGVV